MNLETADVPMMSGSSGNAELIDSAELANRWRVPESWIRNHTRARTPKDERIPCVRLGRYVRFEWGSPRLPEWLAIAAGSFTLHKNRAKPAVFLAGGIGITPFLSIQRQAHHDRLPHHLYLFYSNRRPEDAPFLDTLQNLEKTNPHFHLMHNDRNVEIQERMEGQGGCDRPRDAVQAFGNTAGPHLLQRRTARHGCRHEGDACKRGR